MMKITRFGQHNARKSGVITIASEVVGSRLFYGVSYCSPKEKKYDKQLGINFAIHELAKYKTQNVFVLFEGEIKHKDIILAILYNMLEDENYPSWAEELIVMGIRYPHGLVRFPRKLKDAKKQQYVEINEIQVSSEYDKEQLIMALNYILTNTNVDTDFMAVDALLAMVYYPSKIKVKCS